MTTIILTLDTSYDRTREYYISYHRTLEPTLDITYRVIYPYLR